MTNSKTGSFSVDYMEVSARHEKLGYDVTLFVPSKAAHRPAVRCFVNGKYYENISHLTYKAILDYKGNGNVVHAGTFFGDMLHTFSKSANMVFAFEPVLDNYILAKKNAQNLMLENVILHNAGLGEVNSILKVFTGVQNGVFAGGGSTFAHKSQANGIFESAPVFRLDDLPISDVVLIELDVEGFELFALRGAKAMIERDKPIILVEDNKKNCADFLSEMGYSFVFSTDFLSYWGSAGDLEFLQSLSKLYDENRDID